MIVFDLICDDGHRFEGWFGSSQDFAEQQRGQQEKGEKQYRNNSQYQRRRRKEKRADGLK